MVTEMPYFCLKPAKRVFDPIQRDLASFGGLLPVESGFFHAP